jgi:hypothetical protein
VVGVEKKFLQTPGVTKNVFGHGLQGAVPLINILDLPIATFENGDAAKHFDDGR